MDIWDILAIVFYVLLFSYLFFRVNNVILIKKMDCKEECNKIKKELRDRKFAKIIVAIFIAVLVCIGCFIGGGILLLVLSPFIIIVGISGKSVFPESIQSFFSDYGIIPFIFDFFGVNFYLIIFLWLIRAIYVNITINKFLKDKRSDK